MKRTEATLALAGWLAMSLAVAGVRAAQAGAVPDWEDARLLGLNKEPPHASMVVCPNAGIAQKIRWTANDQRVLSPWYLSLNGAWRFHYGRTRADRVAGFAAPGFDDRSWPLITVPGTMEMQGYGVPIYVNINYPWKDWQKIAPPRISDEDTNNTVGAYRRSFTAPQDWSGRPVFITFDGVYSFFYVWINGEKAGMSKGSRTPAEFNITRYVRPGLNQVAVEVFRWTDGSWLEDQDTWRMSGIYRDVYVWSPGMAHVRDFQVRTEMEAPFASAELSVTAQIHNYGPDARQTRLEAALLDGRGRSVAKWAAPPLQIEPGFERETVLRQTIRQPRLWSAETPELYRLLLTLKDERGKTLEVIPCRVGFRKVESRGGQLVVNGRVVLIKGVNRHEQDLEHGFAVTPESEVRDLELMKQFNINAVRTCHYPDQSSWYDLCDEHGIYLAAECNIETHGARDHGHNPTTNALWGPAYLDRAQRNVETQKNHPAVILWSLGNEAGNGVNMEANYQWIKERDPSRPVFYDDAGHAPNTDLITTMYLKPWDVAKYAHAPQERPMVLCEYEYARGNATGDLWSYWRTFYERQHAQGGFIWDFQDRGLLQPQDRHRHGRFEPPDPGGSNFWAYGGDFGPPGTPSDGNMCCNGIFGADRRPHPGAWEVKHVYQYIHTRPGDLARRTIILRNEHDFLNLKDLVNCSWQVMAEGTELQSGRLKDLDIGPGQERTVTVPLRPFSPKPGVEYWLDVSFKLRRDTLWARAGFEVAWDQMKLPDAAPRPVLAVRSLPPLSVAPVGESIVVSGRDFSAAFDTNTAALASLSTRGTELLQVPLRLHFWRAPVDNDLGYDFEKVHRIWRAALAGCEVKYIHVAQPAANQVVVRTRLSLPRVGATWDTDYTVFGSGDILVQARFDPTNTGLPNLPRLGMQMRLCQGFEHLRWYGRGPQETYSDRQDARVGVYGGTVDEQVVDYSRPGEMGNKVGVRWLALTDEKGVGLLAVGEPVLSAGALHYTTDYLEHQRHLWEVPRYDSITLNLDWGQMGVGGDDGWGARPHEEFQIRCLPRAWSFRLRPIAPADGDCARLARYSLPPPGLAP